MRSHRARLILLGALFVIGCASDHDVAGEGARALEGRLLAPCCWIQTLDVHESELATALRAEIAERLRRGEASEAIEDDLAARFGERIRAVPRGEDPRSFVAAGAFAGMLVALVGLLALLRSWVRRGAVTQPAAEGAPPRDEYDERLDDELARLDER